MNYLPKTKEQIHKENLETLKKMRPLDDELMRMMFRDNLPLAQLVLRIITGKDDLELVSQKTQYDLKRLAGARSICLDVFGRDSLGQLYDLEIQRDDSGTHPRRARYHSAAMDIEFLDKSSVFKELPNTYVIFITENDIFGKGKPLYRIERINTDTGMPFGDGEHIIYANGAYNDLSDSSDIARLMHDFRCTEYNDMHFELMAESMRYYKEEPKGVVNMSKIMENRLKEYGYEVKMMTSIDNATQMLKIGKMTYDEISICTKLPIEEIKELAKEIQPATT